MRLDWEYESYTEMVTEDPIGLRDEAYRLLELTVELNEKLKLAEGKVAGAWWRGLAAGIGYATRLANSSNGTWEPHNPYEEEYNATAASKHEE